MMSINLIYDFHKKVKDNPKQFCKKIKVQCQRIDKLLKKKGIEYCESDVNAFVDMAGLFSHWKGKKSKIVLDDDQLWEIACVLGIKHQDKDGDWVRYFKEYRVFCGKKRGKSVVMALLGIWGLAFDKFNDGAEIYCIATKKAQAKIVYDNANVYRKQNKDISKLIKEKYADGSNYLVCEETNGVFKYLSSSDKGIQGLNTNMALFDESQEVTKFAVIDAVRTSMATKKQPLLVSQSTAGVTSQSAYHKMYEECESLIESGEHNGIFFAIYELDIGDDPSDIKNWIKPNPALSRGRPSLEYLQKEYNSALIGSDGNSMATFLAFHLNRASDGALSFYDINVVKQSLCKFDIDRIRGQYAYGGTDLASYANFACNTCLIPVKHIDEIDLYDFYVIQQYYKAENRLEQDSQADKMTYKNFINTGSENPLASNLLYLCNGDSNKPSDIAEWYRMLRDDYGILFRRIGYDPEYYPAPFVEEMQKRGFSHENVDFSENPPRYLGGILTKVKSKGGKLSDIIKLSKILFENKRIKIEETNKLLLYCLSNVKVSIDNLGKFTITKKGCRGQNDGAMSLLYAIRAWECEKARFENELGYDPSRNRYQ